MAPFITSFLTLFVSAVLLILLIGILVFIHELGHFLAAKFVGIQVNEFALGFGKNLWQKDYKGTKYKLNLIPLGGYVNLEGEDGSGSDLSISYAHKPYWAKAIVLLGGIFMNIVLAFAIYAVYLPFSNYQVTFPAITNYEFVGADARETNGVLISSVLDSSDFKEELHIGDVIVVANGMTITNSESWQAFLEDNKGKEISLTIQDSFGTSERVEKITLPSERKPDGTLLGIGFSSFQLYIVDYPNNIVSAVSHSWNIFAYQGKVLAERVGESISQRNAGIVGEQIGSLVAVGAVVEEYVSAGRIEQILNLTALVSLSLAFFNLLPLPALDGGHLFVITVEAITRRKISPKFMGVVNQIGFILLLGLGIVVIFKDVIQFDVLGRLINLVGSIFGN